MSSVFVGFDCSDRFRTTINVMCDAIGTILVSKMSEKDMAQCDRVSVIVRYV